MKYILDTNAVSDLMKADEAFISHLDRVPRSFVFVPEPVLAEIAYGIERLPKSRRREQLERGYALVRMELQIAPWTEAVSDAFG